MSRWIVFVVAVLAAALSGCHCERPPRTTCETDADCDDGLFCSGPPVCSRGLGGNTCRHEPPCAAGERCDEATRSCAPARDGSLSCEERAPGNACTTSASCGLTVCQPELLEYDWSSVQRDGSLGRPLPSRPLPGGLCGETCDAWRLNDQCAPCAVCNGDTLSGSIRVPLYYFSSVYTGNQTGICRQRCSPSRDATGCDRPGYTCDLSTLTCMEACVDDRQCQMTLEDLDGDGNTEVVDRGASFPAYCDAVTGRCRLRGTPGAQVGDACTRDDQCPDDGVCLWAGDPEGGICSRYGCTAPGFECGSGEVCDVHNAGAESACLVGCEVGAEDGTAAMLGSGGGHPQCGAGRACVWNGAAEPGDPLTGSCVPGEYNDAATPNIGAPCTSASDCYSPFGYGVCLFAAELGTGICTVQSCATFLDESGAQQDGLLPGVSIESPICDGERGETCINLGGRRGSPETYCLSRCESASDCAGGNACAEVIAGTRFCWPYCYEDGECSGGAACLTEAGEPCSSGATCVCSNRI